MKRTERRQVGIRVLGLLACVALNVWIFRYGFLYGLVGLNLTKHVGVALLCQAVSTDRRPDNSPRRRTALHLAHPTPLGPHRQPPLAA